jgi:hypothetical protein
MALKNRWSGMLTGAALLCASNGMSCAISWAQQNDPQSPAQRHDPATSGAGPTSGAPGQYDYDRPKGAPPTTTDARGVTTTHPKGTGAKTDGAKTDAPLDSGNESAGTTAPK